MVSRVKYRFDDFLLDTERSALLRDDEEVPLRRQSYEVLVYLVENSGRLVTREELLEAVWVGKVVTDASITQCLVDIRAALDDVHHEKIFTLTGRGYRFDLPVKREKRAPGVVMDELREPVRAHEQSADDSPKRRSTVLLATSTFALAALAAGWLAIEGVATQGKFESGPEDQHSTAGETAIRQGATSMQRQEDFWQSLHADKSIIVLPFKDFSRDGDQAHLANGIAEEILNLLARVEGLRVISRTSAFSFKGKAITAAEIARRLNVGYVLEGSVRKSGNALRITAQLIDARADAHLWSETYDHSIRDIFDIQDSVAGEVVGHLRTQLSLDPPKAERHDPVAYALYLKANQAEAEETKRELLKQALEIEPDFLDAMAELAFSHRGSSSRASWAEDFETAEWHDKRYRSLSDRVLAQDPGHPFVNAMLAWDELQIPDLVRAAMFTERALESEPTHFNALTTAGEVLVRLGRAEQAIPILRYVTERDPLSSHHFDNLAGAYLDAGEYESAEEAYRLYQVLAPNDGDWAGYGVGMALLLEGKSSEALQHFDETISDMPLRWHGKTLALHDLGRTDDALSELTRLLEVDPDTPNIFWFIGTAYAWIGERDKAFDFFAKQREAGLKVFTSMGESPLYANLRDDPRWQPFLASVGRDPDFLASVEFNPKLPSEIRLLQNASAQ